MPHTEAILPAVTAAQMHTAFELLRLHNRTFAAAMADPVLARIVRARASALRTADYLATHSRTVHHVQRCQLGLDGHPRGWVTQTVAGGVAKNLPELLL